MRPFVCQWETNRIGASAVSVPGILSIGGTYLYKRDFIGIGLVVAKLVGGTVVMHLGIRAIQGDNFDEK